MFFQDHMLNLIDTPGHLDFSFEVRRSLVACDGAILLVAANQGVQAQTIFNFWAAFERDITIVPVINKIDMPVDVSKVEHQLSTLFDFKPNEILKISAKSGKNVSDVLNAIIQRIPSPARADANLPCQAHVFDSWFDSFKGAVLLVLVKQGTLRREMSIRFFSNKEKEYIVSEMGIFHPDMVPTETLNMGQVGFVYCGIKTTTDVLIGDTLFESIIPPDEVTPYVEVARVRPTVYAGLFPIEPSDFEPLRKAVESLHLNDASVYLQPDSSEVFGQGWRVGFIGNLHMEVFGQRLEKEYGELALFTTPSVEYLADIVDNDSIRRNRYNGKAQIPISKPSSFPEVPTDIYRYLEPVSVVTIITPAEFCHNIESHCQQRRGDRLEATYIDTAHMMLKWRLPLVEIIVDFFETLKRLTSGLASFDFKDDGYRECKLEKVCIFVNDKQVEELSFVYPSSMALLKARQVVAKLKEEIIRQQFDITITASFGTSKKAVANAKIKAYRKDFTGRLKGNMVADRLGKKLKHQKEGKEKLKLIGNVQIPREAFVNIMRK